MQSKRERIRIGKEKLQRIIEMCKSVEERSLDPFLIDVSEVISVIKEYFPDWEVPEDLCLDAETVYRLASVIKLQSEWVKHRSTSLYTDPFLLEEKLTRISKEEMVEVFFKAWHPIVELEQISLHSIAEAMKYWENLLPLKERWKEFPTAEFEAGTATRDELIKQRILRDKAFSEELENFWQEMRTKVKEKGDDGKIRYWDFIGAETYEETVHKAFMTSFLITYGYATLEVYPLEEEIFIKPYDKPTTKIGKKQLVSIPIAVTTDNWMKWKRGELK
ncbi:MAG: hypothetical protein QHH18_04875 [Candidatus Bathyarchaeota archaeon]|jgi:hypothetical protein|nr:hypothetical protein [Candidatus Bathyarchaeota archaeon A05DMB-5]MDH7557922.1 hypothetical protein [Candidatus Bathyarchaeota archaeon]